LGSFLDVLGQNYGAGLRLLDFINQSELSRVTINNWVSDQTEGKIKGLIPQGGITQWTRLVLTNAIYFNASWQSPFDKDLTSDGTFHLIDGGNVTVPMMKQTEYFAHIENANYQAVELLYDGQELSMVIFMPKDGQFDAFEESLDADLVQEIVSNLETSRIALTMPKFRYESSFSLKQPLSSMDMEVAFSSNADFSGIDGVHDLYVQDVFHKAFVDVDESRTEAAAASGVVGPPSDIPPQVTIDRSFIFLIRDIPTGTTIFVGRVLNPAAE
jgi:serpin B